MLLFVAVSSENSQLNASTDQLSTTTAVQNEVMNQLQVELNEAQEEFKT